MTSLDRVPKRVLYLPLIAMWFEAIQAGKKKHEYRLCTPFWRKRLEGREYDEIELTLGYPRKTNTTRRLRRPYRGWWTETITHPHFGPQPVKVYVIPVNP